MIERRHILEEFVGHSYNNKKYNTFKSISVSLFIRERQSYSHMPAFLVSQLDLISDTFLSQTNPFGSNRAGPGGRASISPPLLPDYYVYISTERFIIVIIVICLYICLSHEVTSFLRAGTVSYLLLYLHGLIDLRF